MPDSFCAVWRHWMVWNDFVTTPWSPRLSDWVMPLSAAQPPASAAKLKLPWRLNGGIPRILPFKKCLSYVIQLLQNLPRCRPLWTRMIVKDWSNSCAWMRSYTMHPTKTTKTRNLSSTYGQLLLQKWAKTIWMVSIVSHVCPCRFFIFSFFIFYFLFFLSIWVVAGYTAVMHHWQQWWGVASNKSVAVTERVPAAVVAASPRSRDDSRRASQWLHNHWPER